MESRCSYNRSDGGFGQPGSGEQGNVGEDPAQGSAAKHSNSEWHPDPMDGKGFLPSQPLLPQGMEKARLFLSPRSAGVGGKGEAQHVPPHRS